MVTKGRRWKSYLRQEIHDTAADPGLFKLRNHIEPKLIPRARNNAKEIQLSLSSRSQADQALAETQQYLTRAKNVAGDRKLLVHHRRDLSNLAEILHCPISGLPQFDNDHVAALRHLQDICLKQTSKRLLPCMNEVVRY